MKSMIMRGLVIYFFMSMFKRPQPTNVSGKDGQQVTLPSTAATNLYQNGTVMDLYVYLSEDEVFGDFNNSDALVWVHKGLEYGDWYSGDTGDGIYTHSTQIPATEHLQNNGSIFIHCFMVKGGKSPDPSTGKGKFSKKWTLYRTRRLNK